MDDSVWRERCEKTFDVVPEDEIIELKGGEDIIIPWPARAAQLYKARQSETNCWITFSGKNVGSTLDFNSKECQYIHQDNFLGHLKDLIFGKHK